MRYTLLSVFLLLGFSIQALAQQPNPSSLWAVTIQQDTTASSNISVVNQCRGSHNFQIQGQNVPFLNVSQSQVRVNGGQTVNVPVQFNTQNLAVGVHQGQVLVACLTCRNEPTCMQDREVLQVVLTVSQPQNPPPNQPVPNQPQQNPVPGDPISQQAPKGKAPNVGIAFNNFLKGPCPEKEKDCEKLRQKAAALEQAAVEAQAKTDTARKAADEAEARATVAEAAARTAATAAQPNPEGGTITSGGETFSEADNAWLEAKKKKLMDDWKAGKISAEEQQRQRQELSGTDALKKAREERLAHEAKLKKDAEAAKAAAEKARAEADKAKREADDAQKAADDAKKAADEALEEYKKCLKELEEICRRETEAKAAEERRKKEAEAAASAAATEAENRRKAEAENAKTRAAENAYLLDNIKRLGLISSAPFKDIPGAFDAVVDKIIPDILSKTAEQWVAEMATQAAEGVTGNPIPISSIQAIGGLYQIAAALLDPCTQAGKRKTVERLQRMINPKTGQKYTLDEALDKADKMCNLLNELKAKLAAIKKMQGK